MVLAGGDDLEENFVLAGSSSDSESEFESDPIITESRSVEVAERVARGGDDSHSEDDTPAPQAKKQKLNWREAATSATGDIASQKRVLGTSLVAFAKYFPNSESIVTEEGIEKLGFVDCSEYCSQENKTVGYMFAFLNKMTNAIVAGSDDDKALRTVVVAGSATRAMYLIKELREMDSKLAPLPLFFHGGGRKKEQARTHESVLKGRKTSIVVCLPSRLKAVADSGLIDFSSVELVLFDLKQNEKKLNVFSQKDTMHDVLGVIGEHIMNRDCPQLKLALI